MISPLFSRYHSDIGYWGVEKEFFEKFPEFKGVMSEAHVYEPRDGEGGIWNYDGRGGEVRSVSPTSNSSTSSPRDRVQEVLPDTTTEAQMRSSVSVTNSGSTNSTAPSPEEVALGTLDAEGDMDVDMLGTQPMTENVKAEEANNVHAVHALQFDFPPQERGPALGVGYETADAYMMELFNDLPCC